MSLSDVHHQTFSESSVEGRRWLYWRLLLVALVVCLTGLAGVIQLSHLMEENAKSATLLKGTLHSELSRFDYLPELLSVDDRVKNRLQRRDAGVANRYLAFVTATSEANKIFLLDRQGIAIASSNYQDEAHSFVGQDYSFRPYFSETVDSGRRQYYFGKGVTTGIPGFFIAEPVSVNGEIGGVVVVKLELSELLDSWRATRDLVLVADSQNVVILSSQERWMYRLVDSVPELQLAQIRLARQFPDESHALMYTAQLRLTLPIFGILNFWYVDGHWYLVEAFPLPSQDWRLIHLVTIQQLLEPMLYVLLSSLVLATLAWSLLRERAKKLGLRRMVQEAEVRRLQDLQRLIDDIHIGVLLFDHQGIVRSVNRYAGNLLQLEPSLVGETDIRDQLLFDEGVKFCEFLVDPQRTLQYHETCVRHPRDSDAGVIPVMFALAEVEYADSPRYLMTLVNITKRKRAEDALWELNESLESTVLERTRELEQAQQALVQKSKTLALGNMAATIVHELSQPLSAVNSSVAAIEHKSLQQNWIGVGESVARLKPLATKMAKVVQMLKNFSYEDAEDVESVALLTWINRSLEERRDQLAEKGVQVRVEGSAAIELRVSLLKLDLVFSNLLANALDAVEKVASPVIDVTLSEHEKVVSLSVRDNGGGIDEAIMGQLFSPYFTTKGIGKGLGLGLSIANEIAQQLGGSISASNRNGGACFTVTLPAAARSQEPEVLSGVGQRSEQHGDSGKSPSSKNVSERQHDQSAQ